MTDVLVLYWHPTSTPMRPGVAHHLYALERYAAVGGVHYLNSYERTLPTTRLRVSAVVLHTTFLTQRWGDWFGSFKAGFEWIRDLQCNKIAIPQDEYDHPEILDEWMYELGVQTIFTNFPEPDRRPLYPILADRAEFIECLTGYIDPETAASVRARGIPPLSRRQNHVVYRATNLPYWFGEHGQLKGAIGDAATRACERLGLAYDISTRNEDVITGDAWFDFLASGRTVIGAESGSSAIDRRGEVQTALRSMLAAEPDLAFDEAVSRLPPGWDGFGLTAISPRHFEAIVTSTAQILVRGRYGGVLEAGRHYVPVAPDMSDLEDALAQSRDIEMLEEITEHAYADVYLSDKFTYRNFAEELAAVAYRGGEVASTPRIPPSLGPGRGWTEAGRPSTRDARRREELSASFERVKRAFDPGDRLAPVEATAARLAFRLRLARAVARCLLENPALCVLTLRAACGGGNVRAVLRDLIRLTVLREHGRRPTGQEWTAALREEGRVLAVVSSRHPSVDQLRDGAVEHVRWDHSAVGQVVSFFPDDPDEGVLSLGDDAIYEFRALAGVARKRPDLLRRALLQLLQEHA
jgi:hypothetical protein